MYLLIQSDSKVFIRLRQIYITRQYCKLLVNYLCKEMIVNNEPDHLIKIVEVT